MPVKDDDGWGPWKGTEDGGWGRHALTVRCVDGKWVVSARVPSCDGVSCNDGWGCAYCEEKNRSREEIIQDIVQTTVARICADARVEARSVAADMLKCAMRAHWSPLHRVVSGCRLIDDLRSGRVTPLAAPGPFEFLEDVVLDLERDVMRYGEVHVDFSRWEGDCPKGLLYYGHAYGYDGFYQGQGERPRGTAGQCGLVDHWVHGTLALDGLPGLHEEDRAAWGDDEHDWVPFIGPTPGGDGGGRPVPWMGAGFHAYRAHAEFWFAVEQHWDPLPERGSLLREAVFRAWEALNRWPWQAYSRPEYEAEVDRQYERHLLAARLLRAHQRLAMTRAMEEVGKRAQFAMPYDETGPLQVVLALARELTLPMAPAHAAVVLIDRWGEKPCRQATFTAVDVTRVRAQWRRSLEESCAEAKRQVARFALERRHRRTTLDGLPVAKVARVGSTPLSPR